MTHDELREELRTLASAYTSKLSWFKSPEDAEQALSLPLDEPAMRSMLGMCGITYERNTDANRIVFYKDRGTNKVRRRGFGRTDVPRRFDLFEHPLGPVLVVLHNQLTRPEWLDREFKS